ncbi:MAG: UbiA family prenyltransferase [Candidatus Bathyarchaeia archaeon]
MSTPIKGLIALLRLPYWMMSGGLAVLTAFAITHELFNLTTVLLVFFSMSLITSAGFAVNDYFDRESDAIIKPKRPIPAGALSLKQVAATAVILFDAGLVLATLINWLNFIILAVDAVLLLLYSAFVKRRSGFAANVLVGLLVGTAFLYGEAAVSKTISISLSLYPIACGTIGGNILRDILSLDGDSKVGYPTLPQQIGSSKSAKVAAGFFTITGVFAPLPYVLGKFSIWYLLPIMVWSVLLIYSSARLVTMEVTLANVRRYERLITMSMMLLPLSLILEAFSSLIGGFL